MATIQRFEDMEAWQLARKMTACVYALTNRSPFSQDWGLRNQVRDAAGSAMHNVAEGFDAGSDTEFIRFLRYARRSTSEVQSELYIALIRNTSQRQNFTKHTTWRNSANKKLMASSATSSKPNQPNAPPIHQPSDHMTERPYD